jgi:folate-binding protein YgfZ
MIPIDCRAAALPDLGFLALSGNDADSFLSAQLSQRIPPPDSGSACLAAWHDPKGRVRALCRVLATPGALLLIAERAGVVPLAQQLRRYVVRADVHIDDVSDAWRGTALLYATEGPAIDTHVRSLDADSAQLKTGETRNRLQAVRIGPRLVHLFGGPAEIAAVCRELPVADQNAAVRAEIELGLPPLRYWPEPLVLGQMLNLDRLGAIAFDKGCYPGQEILTRTHHLGNIKRRLYRYSAATAPPAPGTPVLDSERTTVGEVIRAASADIGCQLLAVTRIDARDGALVCANATDSPLRRLPLPTDVPDAN